MKQLLLFVGLFIYYLTDAQQVNQCGIIIPPRSVASNFQSVYEARDYVNTMLGSINWQENFSIQEQNGINNAYATIIRNKRYIIYDNIFLENLDGYAGTKWASISVLAHEMGHHYRNHVVDRGGSTPPKEIEADYFSGYLVSARKLIFLKNPCLFFTIDQQGEKKMSCFYPQRSFFSGFRS